MAIALASPLSSCQKRPRISENALGVDSVSALAIAQQISSFVVLSEGELWDQLSVKNVDIKLKGAPHAAIMTKSSSLMLLMADILPPLYVTSKKVSDALRVLVQDGKIVVPPPKPNRITSKLFCDRKYFIKKNLFLLALSQRQKTW